MTSVIRTSVIKTDENHFALTTEIDGVHHVHNSRKSLEVLERETLHRLTVMINGKKFRVIIFKDSPADCFFDYDNVKYDFEPMPTLVSGWEAFVQK